MPSSPAGQVGIDTLLAVPRSSPTPPASTDRDIYLYSYPTTDGAIQLTVLNRDAFALVLTGVEVRASVMPDASGGRQGMIRPLNFGAVPIPLTATWQLGLEPFSWQSDTMSLHTSIPAQRSELVQRTPGHYCVASMRWVRPDTW